MHPCTFSQTIQQYMQKKVMHPKPKKGPINIKLTHKKGKFQNTTPETKTYFEVNPFIPKRTKTKSDLGLDSCLILLTETIN